MLLFTAPYVMVVPVVGVRGSQLLACTRYTIRTYVGLCVFALVFLDRPFSGLSYACRQCYRGDLCVFALSTRRRRRFLFVLPDRDTALKCFVFSCLFCPLFISSFSFFLFYFFGGGGCIL